ncbi:hypothetical protein [Nocardioides eburneiflavus]|uniref:hypothetical protein n=1 Tax=Nocardioides eburneiflavus TaxID=2518372 RepID=UPI00143E026F|nr:hypothetical protein [Nocardioides eburneiflavus]
MPRSCGATAAVLAAGWLVMPALVLLGALVTRIVLGGRARPAPTSAEGRVSPRR